MVGPRCFTRKIKVWLLWWKSMENCRNRRTWHERSTVKGRDFSFWFFVFWIIFYFFFPFCRTLPRPFFDSKVCFLDNKEVRWVPREWKLIAAPNSHVGSCQWKKGDLVNCYDLCSTPFPKWLPAKIIEVDSNKTLYKVFTIKTPVFFSFIS